VPSPAAKRPRLPARPGQARSGGAPRPRTGTRPLRHGRVSAAPDAPVTRSPLTTRAALLLVAISAVAVLLALPARTYFAQQSQINSARAAQAAQQHRIDLLQAAVTRLQDPAAVERAARERLGYVKPGEREYVIVDPPKPRAAAAAVGAAKPVLPVTPEASNVPWWTKLWRPVSR
jgi:cell division protein FtsB